ncbi:MAG: GDSL-type esterase/lipase family protein [Verrucomicrobiales bacterium]
MIVPAMFRAFGFALLAACLPLHAFDPETQDDSAALARHFVAPSDPVGHPLQEGSFRPLPGETISLMGGTTVFAMQDHGTFEAALQAAFPDKQLRVRNLGWPADTVYRQQRPMFFYTEKGDTREGSVPDQREKIEPGTFVLFFGRMESLDGLEALPRFEAAYQSLVERLRGHSRRMVLVGPVPFADAGPAAALSDERNAVLARYGEKVAELAHRNEAVFVDVSGLGEGDFATDGLRLEDAGFRRLAGLLARGLGFEMAIDDEVVAKVREKNHLWHQYYRPTNWAFLFGDRQHVPSSRDHRDANRRWFVEELEKLPAMIEVADEAIWEAAK